MPTRHTSLSGTIGTHRTITTFYKQTGIPPRCTLLWDNQKESDPLAFSLDLKTGKTRLLIASSKSNFEVDSTLHYRESTALQYPMWMTRRHKVSESVTCYPFRLISPWIVVYSLIKWKLSAPQNYIYYPWSIDIS